MNFLQQNWQLAGSTALMLVGAAILWLSKVEDHRVK